MKNILIIAVMVSPLIFISAATKKKAAEGEISTSHSFSDAKVRGRYHTSGEGIATVEDEKVMQDLLSVRKDFKDRVKKSFLEQ